MLGPWAFAKPKLVALWLRRPLNTPHVVCWHGHIAPNLRASTVPLVEYTLRPFPDRGKSPEHLPLEEFGPPTTRGFPATTLGQFRLGSVIRGRECEDTLPEHLTHRDFYVDFSRSGWSLERASDALSPYAPLPVPWLHGLLLDSPLIVFRMAEGHGLLVPCVEFFSRCYGHSKELQRILLTYPWSEVERRLFRNLDPPPPHLEGTWYVRLSHDMVEADAVLLAHIRYDPYTTGAVKRIYSEREVASGTSNPAVPLRIGPWFQDQAKLRVRGYELDARTFLALRVDGTSEPATGPPVYIEKSARASPEEGPKEESASGGDQGYSPPVFRPPPELPTHGHHDPDAAAGRGRSADPDFEILGERRTVVRRTRDREPTERRSGSRRVREPEEFSTSDPRPTGEGVGQLQFTSVRVLETQGVLLDMWNALQFFRERHPREVGSVEWFTFSEGFGSDSPPHLVVFPFAPPSRDDGRVHTTEDKWCLMDPDVPVPDTRARGVLVMRIQVNVVVLCILEIERRIVGDEEKERFSGLVFQLEESDDLHALLPPILSHLPGNRGVFANLPAEHRPKGARSFRHSHAAHSRTPCEAAVLNAFRKMGLKLPDTPRP